MDQEELALLCEDARRLAEASRETPPNPEPVDWPLVGLDLDQVSP